MERVLTFAARFLEEVRDDICRCKMDGSDAPPMIRSVHERPGHATPEYRTLTIPIPDGYGGLSPDVLSGAIAKFAAGKKPDCLLLAFEAENGDGPLLIAEARCRTDAALLEQPYRSPTAAGVGRAPSGGWNDPGRRSFLRCVLRVVVVAPGIVKLKNLSQRSRGHGGPFSLPVPPCHLGPL